MTEWADETARVAFFFDEPSRPIDEHAVGGRVSTLYLLRRELLDTLGHDPNSMCEEHAVQAGAQHRLFASSMLMFTVLDLLAKVAYGDTKGEVGKRFIDLLVSPGGSGITPAEGKIFWLVRNSLVHAFGLPHAEELIDLRLCGMAALRRHPVDPEVFAEFRDDHALLYVDGVYALIVRTIRRRQEATLREPSQTRFYEMFDRYGSIVHWHEDAKP